jgi:hypothetical protein
MIGGGMRGDCPLEIGCKYYINGFCACICQNQTSQLTASLKRLVNQFQEWYEDCDKREKKLELVDYLDHFGSYVFY